MRIYKGANVEGYVLSREGEYPQEDIHLLFIYYACFPGHNTTVASSVVESIPYRCFCAMM